MAPAIDLYLASGSPRRWELLVSLGLRLRRIVAPVDETLLAGEAPADYVRRLALAKARAGQTSLGSVRAPVLGADTTVVLDGELLGKPVDRTAGLAMLARLSGRQHVVFSGVALVQGERCSARVQRSLVRFRELSAAECEAYWATGEPADKAGAYGIQGVGASLVCELHGSHSGVMGLPLCETAELLREFGIDILVGGGRTGSRDDKAGG